MPSTESLTLKLMPFFCNRNHIQYSPGFKQDMKCSQKKTFQIMQYIHHVIHGNYMHFFQCWMQKSILLSSASIVDCHVGDLHSNKGLGGLGTQLPGRAAFCHSITPRSQRMNELRQMRHFRRASENSFDKVSHLRLMTIAKVWESCNKRKSDLEN